MSHLHTNGKASCKKTMTLQNCTSCCRKELWILSCAHILCLGLKQMSLLNNTGSSQSRDWKPVDDFQTKCQWFPSEPVCEKFRLNFFIWHKSWRPLKNLSHPSRNHTLCPTSFFWHIIYIIFKNTLKSSAKCTRGCFFYVLNSPCWIYRNIFFFLLGSMI